MGGACLSSGVLTWHYHLAILEVWGEQVLSRDESNPHRHNPPIFSVNGSSK